MSENLIQKELIKQLSDLLEENNLTEIEWSKGDLKIKVGRNNISQKFANIPLETTENHSEKNNLVEKNNILDKENTIISPMVGTVYLAAEPGGKHFINVGDSISEGQQLLIIEAMKTMNPILASKNGKIVQILVKDGSPVEFGEALVIIE